MLLNDSHCGTSPFHAGLLPAFATVVQISPAAMVQTRDPSIFLRRTVRIEEGPQLHIDESRGTPIIAISEIKNLLSHPIHLATTYGRGDCSDYRRRVDSTNL
ncbi:hypothetical protein Y032_0040g218 [Ancylostoma ceylanicum]|uniref:Uncharacterized protein n=1 Tax=Ancylostoma ceylanicum TaxID=53326 RepID=A0A016UI06_9BILA|nr:hypothetical protein Y032_0040g218 [Ancylostoma ceylanicum]